MCSARRVALPLAPLALVALVALPPLLGCGPRATSTTPEVVDVEATPAILVADRGSGGAPEEGSGGATEPAGEGAAMRAEAPPANVRLTLDKPFVFDGEGVGEVELTLTSVITEMIEESPDDPESYPAGSGVTLSLNLRFGDHQHQEIHFARLSAGYTSTEVVWRGPLRLELRAVEDAEAELFIARLGEVIQDPPPKRVTIRKGEDVALDDELAVRLLSHNSKRSSADGPASSLVSLQFTMSSGERHEVHLPIPPGGTGWSWRDLDFQIVHVSDGESVEVDVGRRELVPLRARG